MEQAKVKPMVQLSAKELIRAAQEFGTPLYVYHAEKIKEQYSKLKNAFSQSNVVFFYACKALTNVSAY
jgi:diaminopimelate decarboxylase